MNVSSSSQSNVKTQPRAHSIFIRRISLSIKLPIIVLLLLALAFLISTYLSIQATQAALIDTLQRELDIQTEAKAEIIRANLISSKSVAVDLAAAAEVTKYDEATILNTIQSTLKYNGQIFGSTIAYEPFQFKPGTYYWSPYYSRTPDGGLQFTQLGKPEYNYFYWDWYKLPKEKRAPVLSPPYFDEGGGEIWMVTWSVPFFNNKTGEIKGVATADVAFSQVQELVNKITVGEKGYAFLIDSKGVILGIGNNGGYYESMKSSMLTLAQDAKNSGWESLISSMIAGGTGFTRAVDTQGRPMFVAYTQIGMDTGWSLGLAFAEDEILAKASLSQNTLIIYSSWIVLVFGVIMYLFTLPITQPLRRLTQHAKTLSSKELQTVEGKLIEPIQIRTRDELEDLAEAFNQMAANLAMGFELLEEKVAERTKSLERSTLEFSIIAEIARDITIIRNLDTLLNVSANLIRERFNYYHVGIFLLDNHGEYAVLRAAGSAAAQKMLDQNYRLRVGQGLVGNVIRTGQAHIALDVGMDAVHFQNPFLPDTHSEIALPLHSRSITIGALDIQTTIESAFNDRDLEILQLLADLLASAIENAELSEQVKEALGELNATYRSQSHQTWQAEIKQRENPAYEYDGLQVRQVPPRLPNDLLKKLESGKPIIIKENGVNQTAAKKTLMVPIKILNQVVGVIGLEQDNPDQPWTEEDIAIVEAAANRAALTLENTRLLEESQRRAVKERAIFEATARIGSALNIENILYTTVEEIERVMNSTEVILQFTNNKKV